MFNDFKRLVLLSITFLLSVLSFAQGLGNSPYSSSGIGDVMNYRGTIRNMGMGYAGSTLGSKEYINFLNPAGLPNMKGKYVDSLVKFDVGYTIQYKRFNAGDNSATSLGANIDHISFLLPISKVVSSGVVLTPLSIVQNHYSYTTSVQNDPFHLNSLNRDVGNGGIYQLQWMNGVSVSKSLALGLTTSYNFGNITQEKSTQLIVNPANPDQENEAGIIVKTNYSGVSFKPGFIYTKQLHKKELITSVDPYGVAHDSLVKKPVPVFFKIGLATEFFPHVKASESNQVFVRNSSNLLAIDSIYSTSRSSVKFPTTYRLGTSLDKPGSWSIAADVMYSDWAGYNSSTNHRDSLNAGSYSFFLGGEIMPHKTAQQLREKNKILKLHRVKTYRAGFSYTASQVNNAGNRLYDYSFSFGTTIPLGIRSKTTGSMVNILPKLNIAFIVGQRTTYASDQLTETYYRLHLSMVIYDKWFNKRRIQ